eukprot:828631-Pelagomonas_calceolata.AAC.1
MSQTAPSQSLKIRDVGQHLQCEIGCDGGSACIKVCPATQQKARYSSHRPPFVMLGSTRGCAQVAGGRSGCDAMSLRRLPASARTPGTPSARSPSATPQDLTLQHD